MRKPSWRVVSRALRWTGLLGLILVGTSIARTLLIAADETPPPRFQGGIVQPELYSVPKQSPAAPPPSSAAAAAPVGVSKGSLQLSVIDQNNKGVKQLDVQIDGPVRRTLTTDNTGSVSVDLPVGRYRLEVPHGCRPGIEVADSSSATIGVAAGQVTQGSLRVTWRHRYRPWHPAFSSVAGKWPLGEPIEVGFYVVDRCASMERAPGVAFPTFVFDLSPNLELASDPPLTSDEKGHGRILVRCKEAGPVKITSRDGANPSDDRLDLLREDISNPSAPECA